MFLFLIFFNTPFDSNTSDSLNSTREQHVILDKIHKFYKHTYMLYIDSMFSFMPYIKGRWQMVCINIKWQHKHWYIDMCARRFFSPSLNTSILSVFFFFSLKNLHENILFTHLNVFFFILWVVCTNFLKGLK